MSTSPIYCADGNRSLKQHIWGPQSLKMLSSWVKLPLRGLINHVYLSLWLTNWQNDCLSSLVWERHPVCLPCVIITFHLHPCNKSLRQIPSAWLFWEGAEFDSLTSPCTATIVFFRLVIPNCWNEFSSVSGWLCCTWRWGHWWTVTRGP